MCGKLVKEAEVEYQTEHGERMIPGRHFSCFLVWQEESRRPSARLKA